ncbi:hypothetical protein Y1Q_0021735 [Alligator mississippiensis]|uniref:Uncharacterized protein n=1 Tax=Alligator mississippiensis TaxID=8496 RepID=A0A151PAP4_ALLMI|nr:hypothetical protein Y1Q_0021735 [Alligator mississippiensis]
MEAERAGLVCTPDSGASGSILCASNQFPACFRTQCGGLRGFSQALIESGSGSELVRMNAFIESPLGQTYTASKQRRKKYTARRVTRPRLLTHSYDKPVAGSTRDADCAVARYYCAVASHDVKHDL